MSDRGLSPGSSAMIDVVVDASVVVKWFIITPFELHVVTPLLEPAFDIALATGRTVYDSIYVALAVALGCKMVTADQKLFNALRDGPFTDDIVWVADTF